MRWFLGLYWLLNIKVSGCKRDAAAFEIFRCAYEFSL
jgi:hypothetical protein